MARKLCLKKVNRSSALLCLIVLLSACSSFKKEAPESAPTQEAITTEAPPTEEEASTFALNEEGELKEAKIAADLDPEELLQQAESETDPVIKNTLYLTAASRFLDRGRTLTAQTTLNKVNAEQLTQEQIYNYQIATAHLQFLDGNSRGAQALLDALGPNGALPTQARLQFLNLQARLYEASQNKLQAIETRLALSDIVGNADANNLNALYRLFLSISPSQLSQLKSEANHPDLAGWQELVKLQKRRALNDDSWFAWQQQFPGHPASPELLTTDPRNAGNAGVAQNFNPSNLALLLPITSRLGPAAQAFKEGFFDAEKQATGQNLTRLYDTGAEANLSPLYYQSAVGDGADFIVGPLGRKAVQALHSQANLAVPTLLIGLLPEYSAHANTWGISLSPEQDAQAIAEQAIQSGLQTAAILRKSNAWGERVSAAFVQAFTALGGQISAEQSFAGNDEASNEAVKGLLAIFDSERRHQQLQALVGTNLQYNAQRRSDIDFVFMAGNAKDARRLVPLLKFYQGQDLPLMATSSVYSGQFDKFKDGDLEGLSFVDLPWLLGQPSFNDPTLVETNSATVDEQAPSTDAVIEPEIENQLAATLAASRTNNLRYGGSALDRIYALGYAAYEAIGQLGTLQANPTQWMNGRTMRLRMDEFRNIDHDRVWGQFTESAVRVKARP